MRIGGGFIALIMGFAAAWPAAGMPIRLPKAMGYDSGWIEPARWRHWRHFRWRYFNWRRHAPFTPPSPEGDTERDSGNYRAHEWMDPPSDTERWRHD